MATVLITGGTGLIGTALTQQLVEKGYDVIILTRRIPLDQSRFSWLKSKVRYAKWDVEQQTIDPIAIRNTDYLVHLAGANVGDRRWTSKRKREIVNSRVQSGNLLVKALTEIPNNIKTIISASGIGYYGPDPEVPNHHPFTETDTNYNDFLGSTCRQWEDVIQPVTQLEKRLVIFRTGIVLSKKAGAFPEFLKPLKFRTATILGSGKQIVSWIHISDITQLYMTALENEDWKGVYNAVAPGFISNKQLIKTIAKKAHKLHVTIHVPSFVLKMVLGELSVEVLKSATVSSAKLQANGYKFLYPQIDNAIADLIA